MKEETLVLQILQYIRGCGFPAWRTHDTRHHPVEEGIADIHAVLPCGFFLALEVKKEGGTTNKMREQKQAEWRARIRNVDGAAYQVESLDDAIQIVEGLLK